MPAVMYGRFFLRFRRAAAVCRSFYGKEVAPPMHIKPLALHKRLLALLLALCLMLTAAPVAFAEDLRSLDIFYAKQQTSSTCTLASAAMMMRRRAYLDGLDNWDTITESSLRRVAWSYVGLSHDFTMLGIEVQHAYFDDDRAVESQLIELLREHPEGIVVYNRNYPHAILVTDYTGGQFYCADPSTAAPSGRIPLSQATITISSAVSYWFVASDINRSSGLGPALTATAAAYPSRLRTGEAFVPSGTITSPGNITSVRLTVLSESGETVQTASAEPNAPTYDLAGLASQLSFQTLGAGQYTFLLTADDDFGGRLNLRKTMIVSGSDTVLASYSGTVPSLSNINAINLTETGFDIESTATDTDDEIVMVSYSAWADGEQFAQSMLGTRSDNDTYTVHVDAEAAVLGIDSFLINITAVDRDGNSARGTLSVKVGLDDSEDTGLVADQQLVQ